MPAVQSPVVWAVCCLVYRPLLRLTFVFSLFFLPYVRFHSVAKDHGNLPTEPIRSPLPVTQSQDIKVKIIGGPAHRPAGVSGTRHDLVYFGETGDENTRLSGRERKWGLRPNKSL